MSKKHEHIMDAFGYYQGGKSCEKKHKQSFMNKIFEGYELKIHAEVKDIDEDQVKEIINQRKHFDHLFCSNFKAIHENKAS